MRYQKKIPKESSFKEYSENRGEVVKTRRPRKYEKATEGVRSQKSEVRGNRKFEGRKPEGERSRGPKSEVRRDRKVSGARDKRSFDKKDSRRTDSKPKKHDRRESRGKSFKEDRRQARVGKKESVVKVKKNVEKKSPRVSKRKFYDAVCKECGAKCQIPFDPAKKPVSCSACFEKAGNPGSGRLNRGDKNKVRTASGVKQLFDAVCMKCKKPCRVPFKPTGKMGVSCSDCFDKEKTPSGKKYGKKKSFGGTKSFGNDKGKKFSRGRSR